MLAQTLLLCRRLYKGALKQRRIWWGQGQGRAPTCTEQQAESPDLKAAFPEYGAVHPQVLQDVLTRLDRALSTYFRRVRPGRRRGIRAFRAPSATIPSPTSSSA